ncbi:Glutamate/aspartate ABC transporter, ATP-binding protein GltL (TC 3.A.1.3.4) [Bathymodiolus thermophilus thioautotrophic gill symbiont]|jgi:general L-amino acid transport system ATP-binding protein|uniref:Glutamate/aspartate ABC transporter, ATP-binding protein GltL (TC 3.A.1.3.4) n=3 Tax=sulfur-oxidizing symbionts TaxID=32036 RepID=A0ACA8ZP24_9GAMM|nr:MULTISPECIES: amino acid ABC transporter ATP-binding protein [Gammaproteobacteria]CAC9427444.1 Glutamate/aspartate ABC transporter, ATP-binding protein GltL (TC 3.A.1.3.4) [uncultured Gammaproteobacteria bacterium]CAB5496819.1 Glutamate/aspartate ABC transporter, ATP-binding protein GltL (TC 3.A.1.3.4) [Bathymodiolus azoricus thioautotrophic gill symbiont]CAB5508073.1 Glutamate/aspartate ABC transporter, ATP-binding protein GltL (TC 3.A.1.3.4) [Bathymodiolus thermophilus thioautotrophic gill 
MSTNIIKINSLNKWYGEFHALKNINFKVKESEIVVICGPSGSGKSTLIRCVNFLEKFQEGSITVDGTVLSDDIKKIRQIRSEVSMVFQHFNLFPHLSIIDNLTLAPIWVHNKSKQVARNKALQLLDRVGIRDQAEKYPNQLSGGQQQRVAIARALCTSPKIMLFDEPTSALDPEMIAEVLDVMVELAKEGITMLCVTHEMGFAKKVADRVIFMDEGQIIEENHPKAFFDKPESERLQLFLKQILSE